MSLTPPLKVQKLQDTLHAKAKDAPNYRFYALYDKMYRADVLEFAFRRCRANDGAAGMDGQTFADIEAYGTEAWLGELAEEAYAAVEQHVCGRLRRWLCKKHKVRGSGMKRYPDEYLHHRLGLIDLRATTRDLPWAKG